MTIFNVIRKSDSTNCYRYTSPTAIEWDQYPFAEYDHIAATDVDPVVIASTIYDGRRVLTKNEFRKLFSFEERKIMDEFEDTYLTLDLPVEVVRNLRTGYRDYDNARDINLDDVGVKYMLVALSQLGKLNGSRIAEVLNG